MKRKHLEMGAFYCLVGFETYYGQDFRRFFNGKKQIIE